MLMGKQSGTATLEFSLAVSYKTKMLLAYDPTVMYLGIYPKELKLKSTQNMHTDIYGGFIHNCPNLEVTEMSFSRKMDKMWYMQPIEYWLATREHELKSHEKT